MNPQNPRCSDDCRRALAALEAYLDGELSAVEVDRMRAHLSACYPCTDRTRFEEQRRALVRRGCIDHAPPELVEQVRARLLGG